MGRMYIVLSDEVERKLRLAAVTVYGGKKGDLSGAIENAVREWLDKHATQDNISKWVNDQLGKPSSKPTHKRRR
ncbi:MAG TPA: ribbon-helix-helix domain-containing protein [Candidatus Bathyarchaeia archaeon]|nr:ribbon-helix-helix domain-containing protein [Candidatus Bathyarchaeia archaeon]